MTAREFWVEGGGRKISVIYGPKYTVAVVLCAARQGLHLLRAHVGHHQWV